MTTVSIIFIKPLNYQSYLHHRCGKGEESQTRPHCHAMPSYIYGCGPCCERNWQLSSLFGPHGRGYGPRLTFTISIPPPPTDMTAKQYAAAGETLQRSFDDGAARTLEQTIRDKCEQFYRMWIPDSKGQRVNVYIFPPEVITSETSILYDQVPSRLYHHGPKHPSWKVPVEIISMIFHQLPLFDRVNLARCSKRLAQIAIENKFLELEFKDRDELSDRKGFFADPSNFPLLWSVGMPGWSNTIYGVVVDTGMDRD